jgi:hypothetical protein
MCVRVLGTVDSLVFSEDVIVRGQDVCPQDLGDVSPKSTPYIQQGFPPDQARAEQEGLAQ